MRTRLYTIYSEEEFNEQLMNNRISNSETLQISKTLSERSTLSFNSLSSFSDSECESKEEQMNNFIALLNKNYQENIFINNTFQSKGSSTEQEICKYLKEIVKNQKIIIFHPKNRKNSYDLQEKTNKIKFRNIVHFIMNNNLNDLLQNNIKSLSFLNICCISNIEIIDINIKNKFIYSLLNEKQNHKSNTKDQINIFQKQILDKNDNKLTTIKIFDICNMEKSLNIYSDLSIVIILFFSGGEQEKSLEMIKFYNKPGKYLIIVENDPEDFMVEEFCKKSKILYFDNSAKASSNLLDKIIFLKKNILIDPENEKEDYDYQMENENEEEGEVDFLQSGMHYSISTFISDEEKEKHQILNLKKRLSLDSSISLRRNTFF